MLYGISDVEVPGASKGAPARKCRIYFPSNDGATFEAKILKVKANSLPLILFVHGSRTKGGVLCPKDQSNDHIRWGLVLHLLARCGFVVAAPAAHDLVDTPDNAGVDELERVLDWMRTDWTHGNLLRSIGATSTGLLGHSNGAAICGGLAVRLNKSVGAVATIAGNWDGYLLGYSSIGKFEAATLLISGTADYTNFLPALQPYSRFLPPKHHAALLGVGHWDYFGTAGGIRFCTAPKKRPWPAAGVITSELVLVFFSMYLLGVESLEPYLLTRAGQRPPIMQHLAPGAGRGLRVRWDAPGSGSWAGDTGDITFGEWTEGSLWK